MEKDSPPLENTTIGLMISTAIFFDVLQWAMAFIFMDWAVSIFAYLTFFVWFEMHGIKFLKPKRFLTGGVSLIFEVIPFVSTIIPALTIAVIIIALDTKVKKMVEGSKTVENDKAA